jgi:hypothetical protein
VDYSVLLKNSCYCGVTDPTSKATLQYENSTLLALLPNLLADVKIYLKLGLNTITSTPICFLVAVTQSKCAKGKSFGSAADMACS